ncbi:Uncharacterised protein [Enterobacter cloacae]|nr:Uncharacterised protein [Enterobacter cloacae]
MVDGASDNITRGQFAPGVKVRHKAGAIRAFQIGAFTAQGFRQQEVARLRVEQGGGVKLIKFEIRHPAAGAPGHRDTVSGGNVRVSGVLIHLGGAARSQHNSLRLTGFHLFSIPVPDPCAYHATRAGQANLVGDNQVNGITSLKNPNIRMAQRFTDQRGFHFFASRIRCVEDAAVAVAAFASQVVALFTVGLNLRIKQYALVDKPLNAMTGVAGDKLRGVRIHDPGPGNQRIFNVGCDTVCLIEHGSNAALSIKRGTFTYRPFTQNDNVLMLGQAQRQRETGSAAADDQYITMEFRCCVHDCCLIY